MIFIINNDEVTNQSIKKNDNNIIVFFDNQGNVVDKENATRVRITELDDNGNIIEEIWGFCNGEMNKSK